MKIYAAKLNVRFRANNEYNTLWTQVVLKDLLMKSRFMNKQR